VFIFLGIRFDNIYFRFCIENDGEQTMGNSNQLDKFLIELSEENTDDIFFVISELGLELDFNRLIKNLKFQDDHRIFLGTIKLIIALEMYEASEILLEISESDSEVKKREKAIWALGEMNLSEFSDKLKKLLNSEKEDSVKLQLNRTINRMKHPSTKIFPWKKISVEKKNVKALHPNDLELLIQKLGISKEDDLKCDFCQSVLTLQEINYIFSKDSKICFCCQNLDCVYKYEEG
jgi:hypothetical protein